jgi:hypothetical protein
VHISIKYDYLPVEQPFCHAFHKILKICRDYVNLRLSFVQACAVFENVHI